MSSRNWIIIIAVVIVVVAGGGFLLLRNNAVPQLQQPENTPAMYEQEDANVTEAPEGMQDEQINGEESQTVTVALTENGYEPQSITIKKGTTVVWKNMSSSPATVDSSVHPTHRDYPPLNLGEFQPDEELQFTFNETGTFKYHNHLNASQFGSVTVTEE